jgi:TRAP-type uncharacterized transport system fused permease subunit
MTRRRVVLVSVAVWAAGVVVGVVTVTVVVLAAPGVVRRWWP